MKSLHYKIITKAPVIIPKSSGDINLIESEDFIPGSVILGAIANLYLDKKNVKDALQDAKFKDFFLSDKVIFTNAMLSKFIDTKNYKAEFFPYCYQYDKTEPSLINNIFNQDDEFFEDKQLKSIAGLFAKKNDDILIKMETVKEINFHHARDRKTGTSKQGIIFNYEAISKGQTFCGEILGETHDLEEIKKLFNSISGIFLGRSKTSQYGKCTIEVGNIEDYKIDTEYNENVLLTFKSDTIIYNKNGFSSPDLNTIQDYLTEILGSKIVINPTKAFIKYKQIENFISVYKIKRIKETAIAAGSCFELQLDKNQLNNLKKYLISGIGIRRNEGFGRIAIDTSEFEKIIQAKSNTKSVSIDLKQLSPSTKILLKNVFEKKILEITKSMALEVVRNNKTSKERRLPNSQLGNIETLIKISDDFVTFKNNLLEKCKKTNINNFDEDDISFKNNYKLDSYYININNSYHKYLTTEQISLNNVIKSKTELTEIFDSLELSEPEKEKLNKKMFKLYFLTLLSGLRKLNKSKEENDDNK